MKRKYFPPRVHGAWEVLLYLNTFSGTEDLRSTLPSGRVDPRVLCAGGVHPASYTGEAEIKVVYETVAPVSRWIEGDILSIDLL